MNRECHNWKCGMKRLGRVAAGGFLCFFLASCAPRVVQVPPEWAAQPPPPVSSLKVGTSTSPPVTQETSPQLPATGVVLKPAPVIREKDLSLPADAAAAPPAKKPQSRSPQRLASAHLVEQAKGSLKQNKPDAAIPLLEQAIQVDVHNGEAFLNLASAWRMKGFRSKALEFAKKAEILFQEQPEKLKEAYLLEAELYKEMGDSRKTELYRQKAAKISSPR